MPRRTTMTLLAALVLLLAACGSDSATTVSQPDPTTSPAATEEPATPTDEEMEMTEGDRIMVPVTGVLGGDENLEGGCMWIQVDDERVQLLPAEGAGFTLDTDALAVVSVDGEVIAEAGDTVVVDGEIDEEMMSFCQVGPILMATSVMPR